MNDKLFESLSERCTKEDFETIDNEVNDSASIDFNAGIFKRGGCFDGTCKESVADSTD